MNIQTERTLHSLENQYYCTSCGCFYEEEVRSCQQCGFETIQIIDKTNLKAYGIDICGIRFLDVLKMHFKVKMPLILCPIVFLLVIVKYSIGKLSGKGWVTPNFEGETKLWKPLEENDFSLKSSAKNAILELEGLGFSTVQTVSLISLYPEFVCIRFEHIEKNCFAIIMVNNMSGEYSFTRFTAISESERLVLVDNATGSSAPCEEIIEKHYPTTPLKTLFDLFLKDAGVKRQYNNFVTFLIASIPYQQKQLETEVASGVLIEMGGEEVAKATPQRMEMCAEHSMAIAVRRCTLCNSNLCEQCVEMVGSEVYCSSCKPVEQTITLAPDVENALIPAGRSPRFMALMTDLILVLAGVGISSYYSVRLGDLSNIVHTTVVSLVLFLYLLFAYKQRRSLGKVIWGVRIKDMDGISEAGATSHFVRVAYKIASFLFIFPLLTYLSLFFNKKGVAVHDKLSTTALFVKSKRNRIIARILMIPFILLFCASLVFPFLMSFGGFFNGKISESLVPQWEVQTAKGTGFIFTSVLNHGDSIVSYENNDSLFVLQIVGGDTLWSQKKGADEHFLSDTSQWGAGVLYANSSASFIAFDVFTGEELWEFPLDDADEYDLNEVTFHKEHILLYRGGLVKLLNRGGEELWSKRFISEEESEEYEYFDVLKVNGGILHFTNRDYESNSMDLSFYSLETGDSLWTKNTQAGQAIFSMGGGVEIINQRGNIIAFDLHAMRPLWKVKERIYTIYREFDLEGKRCLFTNNGVLDGLTGTAVWTYPEGLHYVTSFDSTLFLQSLEGDLISFDLHNWEEKSRWSVDESFPLRYFSRNESEILFIANSMAIFKSKSYLLGIDLKSDNYRKVFLGSGAVDVIGAQDNKLLIKTLKTLGVYSL